jgi:hypothetical protein
MIIRMHLRFRMGVGRLNTDHCIGLFLKYISWVSGARSGGAESPSPPFSETSVFPFVLSVSPGP